MIMCTCALSCMSVAEAAEETCMAIGYRYCLYLGAGRAVDWCD